ncbi:MAG: GNAT family N-acetyltransferase [Flavobacteriales bacterium]|nr:GNAT family N-acetyltransferase [Flavobacteriales bacterium]
MKEGEILIDIARTERDLEQIMSLQLLNHKMSLNAQERKSNGFVTLKHELKQLKKMMASAPQVVARCGDEIVGFALVLLKEQSDMFPILQPMFDLFDETEYEGRLLGETDYYVMGQVCIEANYRGQGIFHQLYEEHKRLLSSRFEHCLTEASIHNKPSMRAHEKVGFITIKEYSDHTDDWAMLLWDWT